MAYLPLPFIHVHSLYRMSEDGTSSDSELEPPEPVRELNSYFLVRTHTRALFLYLL
jgi:hypothetical protein